MLRTVLPRAIAGAAGLAALLTGLAVTRRISRPISRLIGGDPGHGQGGPHRPRR
ncbi:MAG: hypothetical protein M3Z75_16240 [Actinomycetota bacterium]|nr:hypothetical protein [Actinomycetota bacterium]